LPNQRFLVIHLLVGNRILRLQGLIAGQVEPGAVELRLIAHDQPLCLLYGDLEWSRIDLCEQLPCLDHLPFTIMHRFAAGR